MSQHSDCFPLYWPTFPGILQLSDLAMIWSKLQMMYRHFRCEQHSIKYLFELTTLHQNFATSLKGYETTIFDTLTGSRSDLTVKVRNILGIGSSTEMVPWQSRGHLTSIESSRVCLVISAYRLLDVVAILSGAHAAPTVGRRFFQLPNASFRVGISITDLFHLSCQCLQGMDKLANWPQVLGQFRDTLKNPRRRCRFLLKTCPRHFACCV